MTQQTPRQIKLGVILEGVGADHTTWRDPAVRTDASIDINWYIEATRQAEQSKFDLVFIIDSLFITPETAPHFLNRLEPMTMLSAVAAATSKIGLVATVTTSYTEPYNVARQFASLDQISQGRAGWNVVTTALTGAARNFGREDHIDHTVRYARAKEYVDVAKGLWDSYEDGAFPRDKQTGVFLDKTKLHPLNHKGEFFTVAGPLAVTRSPQGQPVLFQAGDSSDGRQLAAQIAEGTITAIEDFESAQEYYADVKRRAAALGRDPDLIRIMPGIAPIIAETDDEAEAIASGHEGDVTIDKRLIELGRSFDNHDFSSYPLDEPFPVMDLANMNGMKGRAERIIRVSGEQNLTLREAAVRFGRRLASFVGSPATVADEMQRWFESGAADGFLLRVARPGDYTMFREKVVPILQERGLFRTEYEADTLRGNLGLPIPPNRWSGAAKA